MKRRILGVYLFGCSSGLSLIGGLIPGKASDSFLLGRGGQANLISLDMEASLISLGDSL